MRKGTVAFFFIAGISFSSEFYYMEKEAGEIVQKRGCRCEPAGELYRCDGRRARIGQMGITFRCSKGTAVIPYGRIIAYEKEY